jgi:hypothetical protein
VRRKRRRALRGRALAAPEFCICLTRWCTCRRDESAPFKLTAPQCQAVAGSCFWKQVGVWRPLMLVVRKRGGPPSAVGLKCGTRGTHENPERCCGCRGRCCCDSRGGRWPVYCSRSRRAQHAARLNGSPHRSGERQAKYGPDRGTRAKKISTSLRSVQWTEIKWGTRDTHENPARSGGCLERSSCDSRRAL